MMTNFADYGFVRIRLISPQVFVAQPEANALNYIAEAKKAALDEVSILVGPELGLTGYTAEDFFFKEDILQGTKRALNKICEASKKDFATTTLIVGAPLRTADGRLYNCAVVIADGKIIGAVPKSHLANNDNFYEERWFTPGKGVEQVVDDFVLSPHQIFQMSELQFAIEICEDAWVCAPPSHIHASVGAHAIFNLSSSNAQIGKPSFRRDLVRILSAQERAAYFYVSSNASESSRDLIFDAHFLASSNGTSMLDHQTFSFENIHFDVEMDLNQILLERGSDKTFGRQRFKKSHYRFHRISQKLLPLSELHSPINPHPFLPAAKDLKERTQEILKMQAFGLARRLQAAKVECAVIGVSGGADSTLALIVAIEAIKILKWDPKQIVAVTMPGFGTSKQTRNQAMELMKHLGVTVRVIPIEQAVLQHFKDIDHDPNKTDIVYENAQARERTQILFDISNQINGLVVGTGDLSELCVGWCTFNGDQMAGYSVNANVPKTLVKELFMTYAEYEPRLSEVLKQIYNTTVSPELKPLDHKGQIAQLTEEQIGPFVLIDFFIYHLLRNHFAAEKIILLATLAFKTSLKEKEIRKWWDVFAKRFRTQRVKTTTLPPGVRIGAVDISPRSTRFPDDIILASENFSLLFR